MVLLWRPFKIQKKITTLAYPRPLKSFKAVNNFNLEVHISSFE